MLVYCLLNSKPNLSLLCPGLLGPAPYELHFLAPFLANFLLGGEGQTSFLSWSVSPWYYQSTPASPSPSPSASPPDPTPRRFHRSWTTSPPQGLRTIPAGSPTAPGSGHPSPPLGSPSPRGEPRFLQILSLGYRWVSPFVLSASTCVGNSQGEVPSVGP